MGDVQVLLQEVHLQFFGLSGITFPQQEQTYSIISRPQKSFALHR